MTPQEHKLLDELFDRLESLEDAPRDGDAVDAINEGLKRAPNAMYPLVQTALVQDEALKRAAARIQELEQELDLQPGEPVKQPGFLDNMRDALIGKREAQSPAQGSVPSVRPGGTPGPSSAWGNAGQGGAYAAQPQAPGGYGYGGPSAGGSFLGTAAASAAGVVGGALLMNSLRGMFGNSHGGQASAFESGGGSPWSSASNSDAARDAGINDVGSSGRTDGDSQRAGLFDTAQNDDDADDDDNYDDDDFDSGDDGGSDTA